MHTVLLTTHFEASAKREGLTHEEIMEIVSTIAANPLAGELMVGTGGARKLRHKGRGQGKSGGYRTVHYYGGDGVPVFLLALINKGERENLSAAERNELATLLPRLAAAYRKR